MALADKMEHKQEILEAKLLFLPYLTFNWEHLAFIYSKQ